MNPAKKILRSFRIGLLGLLHAYRADASFRLELWIGIPAYGILGYILSPMTADEWTWFFFSFALILIVELLNTSIETMLARLHPDEHETIGRSKDIASAAVLIAVAFAAFVIAVLAAARI